MVKFDENLEKIIQIVNTSYSGPDKGLPSREYMWWHVNKIMELYYKVDEAIFDTKTKDLESLSKEERVARYNSLKESGKIDILLDATSNVYLRAVVGSIVSGIKNTSESVNFVDMLMGRFEFPLYMSNFNSACNFTIPSQNVLAHEEKHGVWIHKAECLSECLNEFSIDTLAKDKLKEYFKLDWKKSGGDNKYVIIQHFDKEKNHSVYTFFSRPLYECNTHPKLVDAFARENNLSDSDCQVLGGGYIDVECSGNHPTSVLHGSSETYGCGNPQYGPSVMMILAKSIASIYDISLDNDWDR